jgi:acetate kinase
MKVLVLNSGSSSVKYQLLATETRSALVKGAVERIGAGRAILTQVRTSDGARIKESRTLLDHRDAIKEILTVLLDPERGAVSDQSEIEAVGHRVVHGGEAFTDAALIDEDVFEGIRDCIELAPLHNPHNLAGIGAARATLPEVPHVAVFDTAFHSTLPPVAFHYGIPYVLYRRYRIRRYGFHGTSHAYVARRTSELLEESSANLRIVSIHLGNGASAAAVAGGESLDTSMGFTPLEGLVMGTRSGDLDPAIILHVMAREELTVAEATSLLNKHSGLRGLSGISSDMRDLIKEEAEGDARAGLALDVYCYRIRKYVGAFAAAMGGVDAVSFTGGVGENAAGIRARALQDLDFMGIEVDPEANRALVGGAEGTFHAGSVALSVIGSGEELMIALETERILSTSR